MLLRGSGILALWNGVEATRADEYNIWHSREHVPERVSVPGILSARRYAGGVGFLPEYLTVYDLQSLDVLVGDPYRRLLESPTEGSRSMRPAFRQFFRLPCKRLFSHGSAIGSAVIATTFRLLEKRFDPKRNFIEDLSALSNFTPVIAVHLAVTDNHSPKVPFDIGGATPDYPSDAVLLLEGYDRASLTILQNELTDCLQATGLVDGGLSWTTYDLACIIIGSGV